MRPNTGAVLHRTEGVKKESQADELEEIIVNPLYVIHPKSGATLSGREYNMKTHVIIQPCEEYKTDDGRVIRLLLNSKAVNSRALWNKDGCFKFDFMIGEGFFQFHFWGAVIYGCPSCVRYRQYDSIDIGPHAGLTGIKFRAERILVETNENGFLNTSRPRKK